MESSPPSPIATLLIALALFALCLSACDRNTESFVEGERPRSPDLARIFPESQGGPGTAAPTGGAPPLAGAQRGIPPAAAQPATVGNTITGTVAIGSEIQIDDPSRSMLFVIARKHGVTSGPPVAVLRIPSPRFPMPFEIGPADVMIPSMRFEGDLSISARLDGDGNAMTRTPGDLQGSTTDPLQPGARNVEVLLDQTI